VKPGNLVGWKFQIELGIPGEFGIILERLTIKHEPWPAWKVFFGDRGVLHCRETDLMVMR